MLVRSRLSLGWLSAGRVAYAVAVLSCGWTGVVDCGGTRQRDDSLELDHPLSASPASVLASPPRLGLAPASTKLHLPSGLVPMDLGE